MVDVVYFFFFFNDTATTETYTYGHSLSLRVALPISDHAQGFPARGAGLYRQGNLLRPAGGDAAAGGHGRARPSSATGGRAAIPAQPDRRAGEIGRHTSELQSLMRISYAVFCLKKKNNNKKKTQITELNNTLYK